MKTKKPNTSNGLNGPILIIMFLISSAVFSVFGQNNCKDLLRAVKANDISKVSELLKTVNPNCVFRGDGEPRSPLVAAARKGNLTLVKLLVEAKANVEFHASGDESPLIAASKAGHIETVKYFISQGAEINSKVRSDGTALIASVKNNHIEVAKVLLAKGADPYLASSGDEFPMYHARQSKNKRMIALLETYAKN